ncbi:MAG: hypothetical protein H7329_14520 [Opitutaceae bacterium]|nr:hypothetical protein [Cytophagales bacterium]
MTSKILLFTLASLLFISSCKETKKEEKTENKDKPKTEFPQDQLQVKVNQLEDSSQAAWKFMIEADDQKIAYTKRLLDEISYTPKYNIIKHAKLVEKCAKLKAKRYDTANFSSEKIDKYDIATDSLLKEVKALVLSTPNVENYPLCSELLNDISALDNDVVMHRVKYDNWAMQFNKILADHNEELKSLGQPYDNLHPKGTFQLVE